jgi:23S rRNA (cytidine1920-2'-O)/16S rRNA (cytidine1409-2'-O)-methyltransferase
MRVDEALVKRGLCDSREKAKRFILAGQVRINGRTVEKASDLARLEDVLEVLAQEKFVSRGGLKLDHALETFQISVQGLICVDLGASTGGFTDCLLQRGATLVYAIDVGQGQLAWKLRQNPQVKVFEKVNARNLISNQLGPEFSGADLAVIDCSFISLTKILPSAIELLKASGKIVALLKPQFEAGKAEVDKGAGVIKDPLIHQRVLKETRAFVESDGRLCWVRETESPILGPAGNREFLIQLEKR